MPRFILRLLFAGAVALCVIPSATAQQGERLRVHGSNTIGVRLMPALVESWLQSMGYRQVHATASMRPRSRSLRCVTTYR